MLESDTSTAISITSGPIRGPAAWYRADMERSEKWRHHLAPTEIHEIDIAVRDCVGRGVPLQDIGRDDFPLPTLGPILESCLSQVVSGRGFVLLKGLPVREKSRRWAATAFWGIGTYFGHAVSQNAKGHLLGHVRDIGHDPTNPEHRLYATRARHLFHTDSCDIVGLLCLHPAKRGGLSSVASSVTIFNDLLADRPDLVQQLAGPFYVDRKGEIPEGKAPYYQMAVFHRDGDTLTTIYARDFIEGAQRFPEVARLTGRQREALDALDALANREDIRLDMQLEMGDMQFLHNHTMLHARTAYEDHPEPERKRHLLRLWLAPPNGRPLPEVFAERYGSVTPGARGGIRVPGTVPFAPLEPE
jgi:Taurine catabolism dioxygenase TauD, TfdA family